jgi:hypothetical protein
MYAWNVLKQTNTGFMQSIFNDHNNSTTYLHQTVVSGGGGGGISLILAKLYTDIIHSLFLLRLAVYRTYNTNVSIFRNLSGAKARLFWQSLF